MMDAASQIILIGGMDGTGGGNAGAILILDGITTGIKAAYSTRKLRTVYAGNAILVQRLSDNAQQNIGFVNNVLDTAALALFCSGTTGVIAKWYDQSGGGFDLTPAAIGNAPTIYSSGAVQTLNTKPAPLFVRASSNYLVNAALTANPVNVLYQNIVMLPLDLTSAAFPFCGTVNGTYGYQLLTTGKIELDKIQTAAIGTSTGSLTANVGAIVETQYSLSTGAWSIFINRSASGSGISVQTFVAGTTVIGSLEGVGNFINGPVGEIIMYDLVGGIPGASQTAIENNQSTYWGTP